ncbi:MAG: arylesterase [Saprospiraceae bacterium]|nr:arylesterase [Saprospiraceae bacterium]
MTKQHLAISFLMISLFFACQPKKTAPTNAENNTPSTSTERRENQKVILFFGNSLTAGYGLEESQSFPSLIQKRIDSLELDYRVVNGGISGETSAGGFARIDWTLNQPVNIFILELGANDALRGFDLAATMENLQNIISAVQAKDPQIKIIVAGMKAPPNMGTEYSKSFENIYKQLSRDNDVPLIPFLLEGVAGIPDLNLADGMHPNEEGQKIVRENVWKVLSPLIQS